MTTPLRPITVSCRNCSTEFETWYRPSINLDLDPMTDDELEEMATKTCPECGTRIPLDTLTVNGDEWVVGR